MVPIAAFLLMDGLMRGMVEFCYVEGFLEREFLALYVW